MSPYERLMAERWMPTRFGESIYADREQRDVDALLHEAEYALSKETTHGR